MKHQILARYPIGNPHRVWKQDNFILSTFSCRGKNMRNAVENCAAAGFNLLEMGWADHDQAWEAVHLCEEVGVDLLFQDFSVFGGMQENHLHDERDPQIVKKLTDALRNWKRVLGFYVWDEPYVHDQLEISRDLCDQFQAAAPDKLPFTVAIPSYNTLYRWDNNEFETYLHDYCKTIDPPMLSLDFYPVGLPHYTDEKQLDDSLMWCDLGVMRKLGRQYNMPLWFYYQGVNLYKYHRFTFPMIRMMMYSALLYGVKGLQQFTAVGSVINEDGERDIFFEEQKQIHSEMRMLGNTLMALESDKLFHSADLLPGCSYMDGLADDIAESELFAEALPNRVSAGELVDAYGNRYVLIVNRDFETAKTLSLPLKKQVRLYEVSRETGRQSVVVDSTDRIDVSLEKGDAILYRVQDAAEEAFTIEYRLEK